MHSYCLAKMVLKMTFKLNIMIDNIELRPTCTIHYASLNKHIINVHIQSF